MNKQEKRQIAFIKDEIDILLSPPENFVKLDYYDRLKEYFLASLRPKKPINSIRAFIRFSVLFLMIGLSWLITPICALLKLAKFRFVDIDLRQIGSVLYLDLYLRDNLVNTKSGRSRIFILASKRFDANSYLIDLYKPYVTIIRNPVLKFAMYPLFVSPIFAGASFRFDTIYHTKNDTHEVWNKYSNNEGNSLVSMPTADINHCRATLEKYLPANARFVSLHVRDDGYYNIPAQDTRNADIQTYADAISYIVSKGICVIRIGDPKMVDISNLQERFGPLLFDYAKSDIRSPMMDAYLLSHCDFMIGVCSGPSCIPPLFGVNGLHINWYNPSVGPFFLIGDLCTFKKVRSLQTGKLVSLDALMRPPFSLNPSRKELTKLGYYLEDNSSDEVLRSVQEFMERDSFAPSDRQKRAKDLIEPSNWAYRANGQFSNTILASYADDVS